MTLPLGHPFHPCDSWQKDFGDLRCFHPAPRPNNPDAICGKWADEHVWIPDPDLDPTLDRIITARAGLDALAWDIGRNPAARAAWHTAVRIIDQALQDVTNLPNSAKIE